MSEEDDDSQTTSTIDEEELKILNKKGYQLESKPFNKGSFATVFRGQHSGTTLAIKMIDCEKVSDNYKNKFLPRELFVLKKLKHRFIIAKREILTVNNKVFIIMEFAEGGDLFDYINSKGRLEESIAKPLLRQISEALDYIHSETIAHRDLKCENILLNESKTIAKLTDFGFARTCYDNKSGDRLLSETKCGSLAYVGPELLKGKPFDPIPHDCWSIGVVLYTMTLGKTPFSPKLQPKQLLDKHLTKTYELVDTRISDDCKDIISRLLEPNVKTRLNTKQILSHQWIKNIKV